VDAATRGRPKSSRVTPFVAAIVADRPAMRSVAHAPYCVAGTLSMGVSETYIWPLNGSRSRVPSGENVLPCRLCVRRILGRARAGVSSESGSKSTIAEPTLQAPEPHRETLVGEILVLERPIL
jgi:hypothetical protein